MRRFIIYRPPPFYVYMNAYNIAHDKQLISFGMVLLSYDVDNNVWSDWFMLLANEEGSYYESHNRRVLCCSGCVKSGNLLGVVVRYYSNIFLTCRASARVCVSNHLLCANTIYNVVWIFNGCCRYNINSFFEYPMRCLIISHFVAPCQLAVITLIRNCNCTRKTHWQAFSLPSIGRLSGVNLSNQSGFIRNQVASYK